MNQDYRSDLAAAQARIVELEAELAGHGGDITALEREHAALVRSVPTRARAWLIVGPSLVVAAMTLVPLLLPASPYDQHPRFSVALQMFILGMVAITVVSTWLNRAMGLRTMALSERLMTAERARATMESRVRVAEERRVASVEPALEELENTNDPRASELHWSKGGSNP